MNGYEWVITIYHYLMDTCKMKGLFEYLKISYSSYDITVTLDVWLYVQLKILTHIPYSYQGYICDLKRLSGS